MAETTIKVEDGFVPMSRILRGGGRIRSRTLHENPSPKMLPLEEAAKRVSMIDLQQNGVEKSILTNQELQTIPSKTPVSVLQELLSRRGTTPKYELVQVEGAIHEPTFRYTVSVGETIGPSRLAAMGTGRSKKEAKHAAAKAILDRMSGVIESTEISSSTTNGTSDALVGNIGGPFDERIGANPIGLLQELCMTRRWPPPAYETESEEGLPHERQFTISCLVFRNKETGTGKSKKIAKRLAAHQMWMRLKDLPCENSSINYALDDEDEITQRHPHAEFDSLKTAKIPNASSPYNTKVSYFHKNLKSSSGPKLDELQKTHLTKDSDFNPVKLLQEIASEQQFEVTFVDVEEKSVTGKYQSLVQLSTLPVAVCYGAGVSSSEAQTHAAFNALEYLKLMIKK